MVTLAAVAFLFLVVAVFIVKSVDVAIIVAAYFGHLIIHVSAYASLVPAFLVHFSNRQNQSGSHTDHYCSYSDHSCRCLVFRVRLPVSTALVATCSGRNRNTIHMGKRNIMRTDDWHVSVGPNIVLTIRIATQSLPFLQLL